jgi:hypothetical protein
VVCGMRAKVCYERSLPFLEYPSVGYISFFPFLPLPVWSVVGTCEPSLSVAHGNLCLDVGCACAYLPITPQRKLDLVLAILVVGLK